ncbi:MAG: hypothetical protein RH917_10345 [Lacipirellulaceae bacterium]
MASQTATAQLPTATGRQIAMSQTAWKLFVPDTYQHRPADVADLLIHFHGNPQTIWNNAEYAKLNAVVVTVNYNGLSSAYSGPFSDRELFGALLGEALDKLRSDEDFPTSLAWDRVAVSSFSAGYGAVREILKNEAYVSEIDVLLAADSLYATTAKDGTPLDSQMAGFKAFASMAQGGEKTFVFTHSQVLTHTYENTIETGDELLEHLGIAASRVKTKGLGTLQFYRHAQSGNFQLWGARGDDGDAHLEHLRYIGEFLPLLSLAQLPTTSGENEVDGQVSGDEFLAWQQRKSSDPNTIGNIDKRLERYEDGTSAAVVISFGLIAIVFIGFCLYLLRRRGGKN